MEKKKRIVFYLTDIEYQRMEQKAKECNISANAYAKRKALDEADTVRIKREAAKTMAQLYHWSDLTEDPTAREYLRRGGDQLYRCLK